MARLILLDRDGVINHDSPDYIKDAAEWIPIPGALDAIARLKQAGRLVAVCTNQGGIGRGLFTAAALARIHARMCEELAVRGVALDGLRHCPHHPDDDCACRKPRPGMLLETMKALAVPPAETVLVGDRIKDLQAAAAAGCAAVLVRTGAGGRMETEARRLGFTRVEEDLAAFVDALLGRRQC